MVAGVRSNEWKAVLPQVTNVEKDFLTGANLILLLQALLPDTKPPRPWKLPPKPNKFQINETRSVAVEYAELMGAPPMTWDASSFDDRKGLMGLITWVARYIGHADLGGRGVRQRLDKVRAPAHVRALSQEIAHRLEEYKRLLSQRKLLLRRGEGVLDETHVTTDLSYCAARIGHIRKIIGLLQTNSLQAVDELVQWIKAKTQEANAIIEEFALTITPLEFPVFDELAAVRNGYSDQQTRLEQELDELLRLQSEQEVDSAKRARLAELGQQWQVLFRMRQRFVSEIESAVHEGSVQPQDSARISAALERLRAERAKLGTDIFAQIAEIDDQIKDLAGDGTSLIADHAREIEELRLKYERFKGLLDGQSARDFVVELTAMTSKLEGDYNNKQQLLLNCRKVVARTVPYRTIAVLRDDIRTLTQGSEGVDPRPWENMLGQMQTVAELGNVLIDQEGSDVPRLVIQDFSKLRELAQAFEDVLPDIRASREEMIHMLDSGSFITVLHARVVGYDKVLTLEIDPDVTVEKAANLVRSELAISNPLTASVRGVHLDPTARLFSRLEDKEEEVLFTPADAESPTFVIPQAAVPPIPDGSFRVFSSLNLQSLTQGDVMEIDVDESLEALRRKIAGFLRTKNPNMPAQVVLQLYLPGGVPFEGGTIKDFTVSFPNHAHHLYVVVTRPIAAAVLLSDRAEVLDVGQPDTQLLLSPLYESSSAALSVIASFLNYIHHNGAKTHEIIHWLSKTVPFAPLIAGLHAVATSGPLYGYYLTSITAPLHTLVWQAFGAKSTPGTAFEHLLGYLPILTAPGFEPNVQCSVLTAPFLEVTSEFFFGTFSPDLPTVTFFDPDVRGTDSVQLVYDPELGASATEFRPVPASHLRQSDPVRFVDLNQETCVYAGALLVPSASQAIPLANVESDVQSVTELISIAIDCSISMVGRFKTAQDCFRKIATEATRKGVNSAIGIVQFGYDWKTSVVRDPDLVGSGFDELLDALRPDGHTLLWEGLALAVDQLLENRRKYDGPLRIIAITDGEGSIDRRRVDLINRLVSERIRLDVIITNGKQDDVPPAIASGAKMTGGYLFKINRPTELTSVIEDPAFFDPAIREYGEFKKEHPNKVLRKFSGMTKEQLPAEDDDTSDDELEPILIDTQLRVRPSPVE